MLFEGDALAEYADFYDYSKSYPDAEGNTDPEEEVEIPTLDSGDYHLKLPSGATIGHRSLFVYYKYVFFFWSCQQFSVNIFYLQLTYVFLQFFQAKFEP